MLFRCLDIVRISFRDCFWGNGIVVFDEKVYTVTSEQELAFLVQAGMSDGDFLAPHPNSRTVEIKPYESVC